MAYSKPKADKLTPLNAKQQAFIEAWQETHNATLAAIEAGYSPKSAHVTGSRLLNSAKLQQRMEQYGQLGLDRLAVIASSGNTLQAERAAEALVERAYGKAKQNEQDNRGNSVTINITKLPQEQGTAAVEAAVRGAIAGQDNGGTGSVQG